MTHPELYDIVTRYIHSSKARRFCRANCIELDDATHEIYLKLAVSDLKVVEKPVHWVARCGWRVLLDLTRRNQRVRYSDNLSDIPASVEGETLDERATKLRQVINKLPANQLDALMARAGVSTESCRAIARRSGVTPQTICNWADKAALRVRRQLEELP